MVVGNVFNAAVLLLLVVVKIYIPERMLPTRW